MDRHSILVFDPLPERLDEAVRSRLEAELPDLVVLEAADEKSGLAAVEDVEVLLSYKADIDASVIRAAKNLRLILKYQSGEGKVSVDAAQERGIAVREIPNLALLSVAEFTVMMMLVLVKRFLRAHSDTRRQVWLPEWQPTLTSQTHYAYNWVDLVGFDALYGKTAGLVGLGIIGTAVARLLRPFQMEVLYNKRSRLSDVDEEGLGVQYAELDELLGRSDFVSLHLRLNQDSEKLVGSAEFEKMRATAFLINTSRGRVVDEEALCEALSAQQLAGAALDVFVEEPLPRESPLWQFENVILTPHLAGIPAAKAASLEAGIVMRSMIEYRN